MEYCTEFEALLDLYTDGELSDEEMIRVQAHLDVCPACRAYVDDLLAIRVAFPDAEDTVVPEGFAESVMAQVRKSAAPVKKTARPSQWKKLLMPLAACCAVVVLAVPFSGMLSGGKSEAAPMAAPSAAKVMTEECAAAEAPAEMMVADCAAPEAPAALQAPTAPAGGASAPKYTSGIEEEAAVSFTMTDQSDSAVHSTSRAVPEEEADAETFGLALTLSAEEAGDLLDGCELAEETQTQKTYYLSAEEFDALVLTLEEAGTEVVVSPADSPFFTVTVLQ